MAEERTDAACASASHRKGTLPIPGKQPPMPTYTQTGRLLTFTSPLGADVLLAESLRGAEGISQLFDYEIELLASGDTR